MVDKNFSSNTKIIVLASIVLLLSIISVFDYQRDAKTSEGTINNNAPQIQKQKSFQEMSEYQNLGSDLDLIYKGETNFNGNNNGLKTFNKEYRIDLGEKKIITVNVNSYLYSQGAVLKEGYEGIEWERDLDKEILGFRKLKQGTYITKSLSKSIVASKDSYLIITAKGGDKEPMFAFYDYYFQPSMSDHRRYMLWLDDTNQLVEIYVYPESVYEDAVMRDICYEERCGSITIYPQYVEEFLLELENLLYH